MIEKVVYETDEEKFEQIGGNNMMMWLQNQKWKKAQKNLNKIK